MATLLDSSVLKTEAENSPDIQWLGRGIFTAEGPGSIPDRGTKIPQVKLCGQKIKKIKIKKKKRLREG